MTKILVAIFSREQNLPFLKVCVEHLQAALKKLAHTPTFSWEALLIDFGQHECKEMQKMEGMRYLYNPLASFCRNFNAARAYAFWNGFGYVAYLNDDALVGEGFLQSGVDFLEKNSEAGFVGGLCSINGWCTPISQLHIPQPRPGVVELTQFHRLNWEFSACIIRAKALEDVGGMDENFHKTGYLADNDWLLRAAKKGWKSYRSSLMPFAHAKGITQCEYRLPSYNSPDPIREEGLRYLEKKWNVSFEYAVNAEDGYATPWDVKEK